MIQYMELLDDTFIAEAAPKHTVNTDEIKEAAMKKNILKVTAALAVCLVILWLIQMLLMPKYMTESKEGNLIAEYYDEYGGNDVIFIGVCGFTMLAKLAKYMWRRVRHRIQCSRLMKPQCSH